MSFGPVVEVGKGEAGGLILASDDDGSDRVQLLRADLRPRALDLARQGLQHGAGRCARLGDGLGKRFNGDQFSARFGIAQALAFGAVPGEFGVESFGFALQFGRRTLRSPLSLFQGGQAIVEDGAAVVVATRADVRDRLDVPIPKRARVQLLGIGVRGLAAGLCQGKQFVQVVAGLL